MTAWTKAEDSRLVEMLDGGFDWEEIARDLGRSLLSVKGHAYRESLVESRPPRPVEELRAFWSPRLSGIARVAVDAYRGSA